MPKAYYNSSHFPVFQHPTQQFSTIDIWRSRSALPDSVMRLFYSLQTSLSHLHLIREYASTPYIGMTQSSHRLNSRVKPALFFLSSAHRDENFSSSRYYFSYFFPKISSLYLAKPRKYGLLQFWRFHLG